MELTGPPGTTLRARKSWFLLDNAVIALGSGITSADGYAVETVLENRNLGTGGRHRLTVDGFPQPVVQGSAARFERARWAHIEDVSGYVLLDRGTLRTVREERTGSWRSVNTGADTGGSSVELTRRYLTLWVDHGVSPTDARYAYVLLPGASAAATALWSLSHPVRVLANDAVAQGVEVRRPGLTAVNFWAGGASAGSRPPAPARCWCGVTGPVSRWPWRTPAGP